MNGKSKKSMKILCAVLCCAVLFGVVSFAVVKLSDNTFYLNTPTVIGLNSKTDGIITSETDYEAYLFEVTQNGSLSISLDHETFADTAKDGWNIILYKILDDGTGNHEYKELCYFQSFWSDVTSSWGETGVTPGEYCVMVEPGDYILDEHFTLVVRFSQSESFEQEFNDTPETAMPITQSKALYGSSSQRSEGTDTDYYKLTLAEDGFVNVYFAHDDESLPTVAWIISLVAEDGTSIFDFSSQLGQPLLSSGEICLKAGEYYLRVDSQVAIGLTYKIYFETGKKANCEFELNDSPDEATLLGCDEVMTGCLSPRLLGLDKDYYKINLTEDGYIDLYFSHDKREDDKNGWNIRLFQKQEDGELLELIKKVSAWNDNGISVKQIGLSAGEYYICIDADSMSYLSDEYKVFWQQTKTDTFESESNNSIETADPVKVSEYYYGKLITKDVEFDEDFYSFEVDVPRNIAVQLWHENVGDSSVAWTVSVLDKDGNVIKSVMSSKDEVAVSTGIVEIAEAGTYYIHVETGMVESEEAYHFIVIV